nr:hypothetical protein [uncultured Campylobacter sp.]
MAAIFINLLFYSVKFENLQDFYRADRYSGCFYEFVLGFKFIKFNYVKI